jgi:hypothetical protein
VNPLAKVKQAAERRATGEREWRNAIRSARADGISLRAIAGAAGVSHVRVMQILRESEVTVQTDE